MTTDLLKFGMVMLVVMLGFVMSFHAIANGSNSFGETWLDIFKAMLGEVDLFDDFAGGPYDPAATLLLVVYLLVITVMLLNLLIAVLSTLHGQVAGNAEREYKVTKARLIKYYRQVVKEDLLPVPFNLVQLVASLPFVYFKGEQPASMEAYDHVRRIVGYTSFWLAIGPFAFIVGILLWLVSFFCSPFVLYSHALKKKKSRDNSGRLFVWYTVSMCRIIVAPFWLFLMWLRGPATWFNSLRNASPQAESSPIRKLNSLRPRAFQIDREAKSVDAMLRAAPGSLEAEQLRMYLKNPMSDPEVRQDEKKKVATVEHLKLLRDRIDNELKRQEGIFTARLHQFQTQQSMIMETMSEVLRIVKQGSEDVRL